VSEGTHLSADIDTGTSTDEPDPPRGDQRSAAARNTVDIDGSDSTEARGAFRARRWVMTRDGLRIDDLVTGRGRHEIVIRWHLSVGATAQVTNDTALVTSVAGVFLLTVQATSPVVLAVETTPVASGFAGTADAPVLTCRMDADLPARATTRWSRAPATAHRR
jgi:Heparinase II/III-like protein